VGPCVRFLGDIMRKLLLVALAGFGLAAPALANNVIYSENFDSFDPANPDFTSTYGFQGSTGINPNALENEGMYAVGADAHDYHAAWMSYTDHTSGSGNYLIVNGDTDTNATVWQSGSITLTAGVYTFSAWVANSCCNIPGISTADNLPILTFTGTIGTLSQGLGSGTVPLDNPGTWHQIFSTFTVTDTTTGMLTLRNSQNAAQGNDFGVDDIVLNVGPLPVSGVPEAATWGMMVLGFGAIGAASRRRRTSLTFA
jgi:hypothetical protein